MVLHGDDLENLVLSSVSIKGAWKTSEKSISGFHMKEKKNQSLHVDNKIWDSRYLAYWICSGSCLFLPWMTLYISWVPLQKLWYISAIMVMGIPLLTGSTYLLQMQHAVIQALLKAIDSKYFTMSSISYFQELVNSWFIKEVGLISFLFL